MPNRIAGPACILGICLAFFLCVLEFFRLEAWKRQKADIENALEKYREDCLCYPTPQQGIVSLFRKPVLYPVPENWDGPYAMTSTYDPWGRRLSLDDFLDWDSSGE